MVYHCVVVVVVVVVDCYISTQMDLKQWWKKYSHSNLYLKVHELHFVGVATRCKLDDSCHENRFCWRDGRTDGRTDTRTRSVHISRVNSDLRSQSIIQYRRSLLQVKRTCSKSVKVLAQNVLKVSFFL